jgi:hypothetical protein
MNFYLFIKLNTSLDKKKLIISLVSIVLLARSPDTHVRV